MKRPFCRLTLSLGLPVLLSACTAGPNYQPPSQLANGATLQGRFLRAGDADTSAPIARWWVGLDDAELTRLIEQGLAAAPRIEAAEARVRQARAGLAGARARLLPVVSGSVNYVYADLPNGALGGSGGATDLLNAGFDTQWEIDLWGAKRRGVERSRAEAEAVAAQFDDIGLILSAEIARTYVTLRMREASLAQVASRQNIEARLLGYARQRFDAGAASRQPIETAAATLERTGAEHAALDAECTVLRDELAFLVGAPPGTMDKLGAAAIPLPPARVAVGDPSTLLMHRPDVRMAERRLAAANAQIGVEAARRFPSVTLLGLIGIGGQSGSDLFDVSQLAGIAAPRLSWSFLDFGRARAARDVAAAASDGALAQYREAVLAALRDAEAALARYGSARIAYGRTIDAAGHVRNIAGMQKLRATAGALSEAGELEAERQAIDAELAAINGRGELTLGYIVLVKALGLGWSGEVDHP